MVWLDRLPYPWFSRFQHASHQRGHDLHHMHCMHEHICSAQEVGWEVVWDVALRECNQDCSYSEGPLSPLPRRHLSMPIRDWSPSWRDTETAATFELPFSSVNFISFSRSPVHL